MVIISYFTKRKDPALIQGLTMGSFTPAQRAEVRASWTNWDVVHSVIIITVILVFYVYFW
jgi:solute:Na+ symporter, SSS family